MGHSSQVWVQVFEKEENESSRMHLHEKLTGRYIRWLTKHL